jgi:hypothetical protein
MVTWDICTGLARGIPTGNVSTELMRTGSPHSNDLLEDYKRGLASGSSESGYGFCGELNTVPGHVWYLDCSVDDGKSASQEIGRNQFGVLRQIPGRRRSHQADR